jgi:serine/threonine protein kinase
MNDIFYSLYLLNKNNFIHGNLIPENILFFQNQNSLKYNLKLNDFSYYLYFEPKKHKKYNYYFYSPEVLLNNDFSIKSDIWSAGVIMYILLLGKFPFISENIDILKENIINQEINFNNDNIIIDDLEKDLLIRLLEKNKEIRINLEDILNHKYFDKNNFFLLENSSEDNNKSFNSSEISENIILSINYLIKNFLIFIIIFNELNEEVIKNIFYNYIKNQIIIENYQEKIFKFIDDNSIDINDKKIDKILNSFLINKIYLSENNINIIFNYFKNNIELNEDNLKLKNNFN